MSTRTAAFIVLTLLILVGAGYLYQTYLLSGRLPAGQYGPVRFPFALGAILIALCLVELVRELRRQPAAAESGEPEERLEIANVGKLVMTVVLTGLYFYLWQRFGMFYLFTGGFVLSLLLVYRGYGGPGAVAALAGFAAVFVLVIYLVFQLAFGIRLT